MASLTYVQLSPGVYEFTVSGTIITGEVFKITAGTYDNIGDPQRVTFIYTALSGDTIQDVINGLYATVDPFYRVSSGTTSFVVDLGTDGTRFGRVLSATTTSTTTPPPPPSTSVDYGLYALCTFDRLFKQPVLADEHYRLEFYKKGFSGSEKSLTGASVPVIHGWDLDEPKPGIKGSNLKITVKGDINTKLNFFYTNEDDGIKVRLVYVYRSALLVNTSKTLFEGFLVQDDCSEIMADYAHEIQLSANDNLGLLKDVSLDTAIGKIYEKKSLGFLISKILLQTGNQLNINVFANILETTQDDTRSFLEQTLVATESFMTNETDFDNCYNVLQKILERVNLTLFQANGEWNLVRWDELRYAANYQIPGFLYDKDFTYLSTTLLDVPYTAGLNEDTKAETGLLNKIFRPFKYSKETFNYKQPSQLLRNANLTLLGDIISTTTSGSGSSLRKVTDYKEAWWSNVGASEHFIRVVRDQYDNELERFMVVKGDRIKSFKIEANKGDLLNISFDVRIPDPIMFSRSEKYIFSLTDGITTVYINNYENVGPGTIFSDDKTRWHYTETFKHRFESGTGGEWVSVNVKSDPIPIDGIFNINLHYFNLVATTTSEVHYKDIRLDYTPLVNDSTKIIGHTHTDTQKDTDKQNIKNKEEEEIYIDSSPRNSIAGTLYVDELIGLLQKRAERWTRGNLYGFGEERRLGEITTYETLFWRQKSRTILEGRFNQILKNHAHISPLNSINYTEHPGLNFIFGKLEIDYKNNMFSGTLWENHTDSEVGGLLTSDYRFDYLYDAK